jgi:hypothetical protein
MRQRDKNLLSRTFILAGRAKISLNDDTAMKK